jgi:hypothetical protein
MASNYVPRVMASVFLHVKQQCPTCLHRRDHGEWEGYCTLKSRVLSWAAEDRSVKRCKDNATLATEAAALHRRLRRAWGVESFGTRRYWRLHGLITRAEGRANARQQE